MPNLSSRNDAVKPSPTLAITARANAMRAQGEDVVGFGAGEPDFATPTHISDACVAALRAGFTRYTPEAGIPELRTAIASRASRDLGVSFTNDNVAVTVGGKQGIYEFFLAVLEPGDEVLIPTPCWVSYPDQVTIAGGKPVYVEGPADRDFVPSPSQLAAAVTPRTRALRSARRPTRPARLVGGRPGRGGGAGAATRPVDPVGRDLLRAGLRGPPPLDPARRPRRGLARLLVQRREQDLRHDRLARGVGRRAASAGQGDRRPHRAHGLRSHVLRPEGRRRRAHRVAGRRPALARHVPRTAGPHRRAVCGDPRLQAVQPGRRVLPVGRRAGRPRARRPRLRHLG